MPGQFPLKRSGIGLALGSLVAVAVLTALSSASEPLDAKPFSLLVLKSGRMVQGEINQSAGGYLVKLDNGSLLVPLDLVEFAARDRHDAYQKMRQRLPAETAAGHAAVARWCLGHEMYDEARAELREALTIEPDHRESRSILKNLDELLHTDAATGTEAGPPSRAAAPPPPEARSLAGLSRDGARDFVTRIQPLLMNKCGNAACHGVAADNDFRLAPVRRGRGAHRLLTERNLAATLKFVDLTRPEQSPLLVEPQGNHGHNGGTVFEGVGADQQLESLRQWVYGVARDQAQGIDQSQEPWALGRQAADDASEFTLIRGRPEPDGPAAEPAEDILDRVLREERDDEFDPAEFNRRVHGTPR